MTPPITPYEIRDILHAAFSVEEVKKTIQVNKEKIKKNMELFRAPKSNTLKYLRGQVETYSDATTLPMPSRKDVLSFLRKQLSSFSSEKKSVFFNQGDLHFDRYNVIASRESLVLLQNFLLRKKKRKKKSKTTLEDLSSGVLLGIRDPNY